MSEIIYRHEMTPEQITEAEKSLPEGWCIDAVYKPFQPFQSPVFCELTVGPTTPEERDARRAALAERAGLRIVAAAIRGQVEPK